MISLNFVSFLLSFILVSISVLGYGFFFLKFNNLKNNINFGYIGIFGIFVLIFYSYLSNLIVSHSQLHNSVILFIGIFFFILYFKELLIKFNLRNDVFLFSLIFPLLFVSILIIKNHDDFSYYHFQYTYYLTQESFNFGVGQFNHGFRTPSSIFYLNSLFYLPFVDYHLFNFSSVLILGFANIILLNKIGISYKKNSYTKAKDQSQFFIKYLSLFCLIFINIFFYRISEHGTDRSAQILILILIIEILDFFLKRNFDKSKLVFLFTLFGLIVSLKALYFLYLVFLIPIFSFILNNKKTITKTLKELFLNRYFLFVLLLLLLVIFSYLSNTGCLLYPLKISCFEELSWAIPLSEVTHMNNWYELWSKGGANPNYRVGNPEEYIRGFNWLSNWFNEYFFNKVSDFIIGILFVIIVFLAFFYRPSLKKIKNKHDKYVIFTFFLLIIIFCEWFYNHPSLRYGGYSVIALLFFIPSSIFLSNYNISLKKFNHFAVILTILAVTIFLLRNINRIDKEITKYNYKPLKETYYSINKKYFILQNNMNDLKDNYENCQNIKIDCDLDKKKLNKINSKYIFKY